MDANILLLNRSYQALRVIGIRKAFTLLYRGMAEVLYIENDAAGKSKWHNINFEEWAELSALKAEFEPDDCTWIHTVNLQIAVPTIIRLVGYDRLPKQIVKFNRRNLYARDGNRCQYCGGKFPTQELTLDHVTPRNQGGKTRWDNIVCACVACNSKKGGRTPEQAGMRLRAKPVCPKRSPIITLKLAEERYSTWKHFLDAAYWSVELR